MPRDTYTCSIPLTRDNAVEALLEPSNGLLRLDLVREANTASLGLSASDTETGAAHDDVAVEARKM